MNRSSPVQRAASIACVLLFGCAGGPRAQVASAVERHQHEAAFAAYAEVQRVDGHDPALLALLAGLVLEEAAMAEDPAVRRAAVAQLATAGTAGRPFLERLSRTEGRGTVLALIELAQRGDRDSRRLVRGWLDAEDAEMRAAAIAGTSARDDRDLLLQRAEDTSADVRRAVCRKLQELAPDSDARGILETRARLDSEPAVRAAAVRALASFGAESSVIEALTERLSDPEITVRRAALESLARADRDAARPVLLDWLALPTSDTSIDAARLLATSFERGVNVPEADAQQGRDYLANALQAADPGLRNQAVIALIGLPFESNVQSVAVRALEGERDAGVRLSLARLLYPQAPDIARPVLEQLANDDHGMHGLQAALIVAGSGQEAALNVVRAALQSSDTRLRQVAARGLARDCNRPEEVAFLLEDESVEVRISAAGGILAYHASTSP